MNSELEFDDRSLGRWTREECFEVTRDHIAAYAAATNDPILAHRDGDIAPPLFAIVPVFKTMMAVGAEAIPPELITRVLHSGHDIRFHRPICPGDTLIARGKMIGYEGMFRGSRAQKGTRVAMLIECRNGCGDLINEQYATSLVLGFNAGRTVGELSPQHMVAAEVRDQEPTAQVVQRVDADQTFRYSAASGDPMPIHLDDQVAIEAGLPGIIVHGLCTMAFASWAVLTQAGHSDVRRLKRIAVRFSKMVLPGDDLNTQIWKVHEAEGVASYAFETMRDGDYVITDGLAQIAT